MQTVRDCEEKVLRVAEEWFQTENGIVPKEDLKLFLAVRHWQRRVESEKEKIHNPREWVERRTKPIIVFDT